MDNLNWPPLASRGWAPLAAIPLPEGGVAGVEGGKKLKILTWNVLCDGLSGAHPTRGGFLKAPEGSLDWDNRRYEIVFGGDGFEASVENWGACIDSFIFLVTPKTSTCSQASISVPVDWLVGRPVLSYP